MNYNKVKLTESQIHNIIKESINKVLGESTLNEMGPNGEYTSEEDYWNAFYKNVYQAHEALARALSFCDDKMRKDVAVRCIIKDYQSINNTVYFINQRQKKQSNK